VEARPGQRLGNPEFQDRLEGVDWTGGPAAGRPVVRNLSAFFHGCDHGYRPVDFSAERCFTQDDDIKPTG